MRAWVVCTGTFIGAVSGKEYARGTVYSVIADSAVDENPLWRVENNDVAVFTNFSLMGRGSKFRRFDNEFLGRAYAATLNDQPTP